MNKTIIALLFALPGLAYNLYGQCNQATSINLNANWQNVGIGWYRFTPPEDGEVNFCFLGMDYVVYDGCSNNSPNNQLTPDPTGDVCGNIPCGDAAVTRLEVFKGDNIWIQVKPPFGDPCGNFVGLRFIGKGDNCLSPALIECNNITEFGVDYFTNRFDSHDLNACGGGTANTTGQDRVFELVVSTPTDLTITLNSNKANRDFLGVFLYCADCSAGCFMDGCMGYSQTISGVETVFIPQALGTYLIVADWSPTNPADMAAGINFELLVTCGDPCTEAQEIHCGETVSSTTIGQSNLFNKADYASCYNGASTFNGPDRIFKIVKPSNQGNLMINLFTTGSNDLNVTVFSQCGGPCLAIGATYSSTLKYIQDVDPPLAAGTYYIIVDGANPSGGYNFDLTVTCGDLVCTNATPIKCGEPLMNQSNLNTINNTSVYGCDDVNGPIPGYTGDERVYTFQLNTVSNVTIDLSSITPSAQDLDLLLLDACSETSCLRSSGNPPGNNEQIIANNLPAGIYYIVVDGWQNGAATYTLSANWANCCADEVDNNCQILQYQYNSTLPNGDVRYCFNLNFPAPLPVVSSNWVTVNSVTVVPATPTLIQSFCYNFPNPGTYVVCYNAVDNNGCLYQCCRTIEIVDASNTQNCVHGNNSVNKPTKVRWVNGDIYVASTNASSGNPDFPNGAFSRYDASGNLVWAVQLDAQSIITDFAPTDDGAFLLVGHTPVPSPTNNNSIILKIGANGTLISSNYLSNTGRELMTAIVRHPFPSDPANPYYISGFENKSGTNTSDNIVLYNLNQDGVIKWKKLFNNSNDDEYGRGLFPLNNGHLVLYGNDVVFTGYFVEVDGNGNYVTARHDGSDFRSFYTGLSLPNNQIVMGGDLTTAPVQAALTKMSDKYIPVWTYRISSQTRIAAIDRDDNGNIYALGYAPVGGISTPIINKIRDNGNSATLLWSRHLNDGSITNASVIDGNMDILGTGNIVYADGRRSTQYGFQQEDLLVVLTDTELSTCYTENATMALQTFSFSLDSVPNNQDSVSTTLSAGPGVNTWAQMHQCVCSNCTALFTHSGSTSNCFEYSFSNTSTGYGLSYQWNFGDGGTSTTQNPTHIYAAPGNYNVCLTVNNGECSNTYCLMLQVNGPVFSIQCPSNQVKQTLPGLCQGNALLPATSVIHPPCLQVSAVTCVRNDGQPISANFPLGITVVACSATDEYGNTKSCSYTVTVVDSEAPKLVNCPPAGYLVPTSPGLCTGIQNIPSPSATDNCTAPVFAGGIRSDGLSMNAPWPKGITTVVFTVTDNAGNSATCSTFVNVIDQEPPVPICASYEVKTDQGVCEATYTPPFPFTTDNCTAAGNFMFTGVRHDNLPMNAPWPIGITCLTWTVKDEAGNTATCEGCVSVEYEFQCPANDTICAETQCEDQIPDFSELITICDGFIQVEGYRSHTLAIGADGTLWAWGNNSNGELGDGTYLDKHIPIQVGMDRDWVKLASGNNAIHSMAIKSDGTLWAWGVGNSGELGLGIFTLKNKPTKVGIDQDWKMVAISAGHSLAIKTDGTLWATGSNFYGQLGLGNLSSTNVFQQVGAANDWFTISTGTAYSMAIKTDGTLWAWGLNGYFGKLGLGDQSNSIRKYPIQVGIDKDWKFVSCGEEHTMAIKQDGTLWGWGKNGNFQLGLGNTTTHFSPVQVGSNTDWIQVNIGTVSSLGVRANGNLEAWGNNGFGQLGFGDYIARTSPTFTGHRTNAGKVDVSETSSFARLDGSGWFGWGYNAFNGQLGIGNLQNQTSPALIQSALFSVKQSPLPGTIIDLGCYEINLFVEDTFGRKDTCHFIYCVKDTIPPTIKCPPNTLHFVAQGQSGGNVTFPPSQVTDNCLALWACTYQSGDFFPLGITTVTCTAVDEAGNSASCSFTVEVKTEPGNCPPGCRTPNLNISTGFDPNTGGYIASGGNDPLWQLTQVPPTVNWNTPSPSFVITQNAAWDINGTFCIPANPNSTNCPGWISGQPFGNYTQNNCGNGSCAPCIPEVYQFERTFCVCDGGPVTINFNFAADDYARISLLNVSTGIETQLATHGCNWTSPPTHHNNFKIPTAFNQTYNLAAGQYRLIARLWNTDGDWMGLNIRGTVSGAGVELDRCCSPNGSIAGVKYLDNDCDGVRDEPNNPLAANHEEGLSNWEIRLCDLNGNVVATELTGGNGGFAFLNVPSGNYIVKEVNQPGYAQSAPASGGTYPVTITPNSVVGGLQFGNCISDTCCQNNALFIQQILSGVSFQRDACTVQVQWPDFDECKQVTIRWDDGTITGPFSGAVKESHTYAASGNYEICAKVEEIGAQGMPCFVLDTCWTVCVVCDTCEKKILAPNWQQQFTGNDWNTFYDVAVSPAGEVYAIGNMRGTVDIQGNLISSIDAEGDVILAKFKPDGTLDGNHLYRFGGDGGGGDLGETVKIAPNGDIVVGGRVTGQNIDFAFNGLASGASVPNGVPNAIGTFIARYNPQFELLWFDVSIGSDRVADIGFLENNDIIAVGSSIKAKQSFIARFVPDGMAANKWIPDPNWPTWPIKFGGVTPSGQVGNRCWTVETDPVGGIYVCGDFSTQITLGSKTLGGTNNYANGFVANLDKNGHINWAFDIPGAPDNNGHIAKGATFALSVDYPYLYILGNGSNQLDPTPAHAATFQNLGNPNIRDIYVAKYKVDSDPTAGASPGGLQWAFGIPDVGTDYCDLQLDGMGNLLLTGDLIGVDINFDPNSNTNQDAKLTAVGDRDFFLAKYTDLANGANLPKFVDALGIGGLGPDISYGMATHNGDIYIAGSLDHFAFPNFVEADPYLGKFRCECPNEQAASCCDEVSISSHSDPANSACCHTFDLSNSAGTDMSKLEIELLETSDWAINTSSLSIATGFVLNNSSNSGLSIGHTTGVLPKGGFPNFLSLCLDDLVNPAVVTQTLVFHWFEKLPDGTSRLGCSDTIKLSCESPVTPQACVTLSDLTVNCDPDNPQDYILSFRVTNNNLAPFDAYQVVLQDIKSGFGFHPCNGSGFQDPIYLQPSPLPLQSGQTSAPICVKITSLAPILSPVSICFRVGLEGLNGCCYADEDVCVELVPCCSPCEDVEVSLHEITYDSAACCYGVDLLNACNQIYFSKVEFELLTPGVTFGSHFLGDPAHWQVCGATTAKVCVSHQNGSIPANNFPDFFQFCLDGITSGAQQPQIIKVTYFTTSAAGDVIACTSTLQTDCEAPVDNKCLVLSDTEVKCLPNQQAYEVTFKVINVANPPFTATELGILPLMAGVTINPNPIAIVGGLSPGDPPVSLKTLIKPTVWDPNAVWSLPLALRLSYLNGDSCCNESFLTTLMFPACTDTACCLNFAGVTPAINPFNTNPLKFYGEDFVDFDHDGDFDLSVWFPISPDFRYYENTGTNSSPVFASTTSLLPNILDRGAIYSYDYSNSGSDFFQYYDGGVTTGDILYYYQYNGGSYTEHNLGSTGIFSSNPAQFAIGDLSNDGIPDLVIVFPGAGVYYCEGLKNYPDLPEFTAPNVFFVTTGNFGEFPVPEIFDADCDGDLDLFISFSSEVRLFENKGTIVPPGSLPDLETINYKSNPYGITGLLGTDEFPTPRFVDINADSKADLFVKNGSEIKYYENCSESSNVNSAPLNKFRIYPNPTTGYLFIEFEQPLESEHQLQLYDIMGRQLDIMNLPTGQMRIQLNYSGLPSGLYLLEVMGKTGFAEYQKVLISRG